MKRKVKSVFYTFKKEETFILLGHRKSGADQFWWIPGGSIEGNEAPFEALLRELKEEINTGYLFQERLKQVALNPEKAKSVAYTSETTSYHVYFIELPVEVLEEPIEVVEEFTEAKWFPVKGIPANMSREYQFIAEEVEALSKP